MRRGLVNGAPGGITSGAPQSTPAVARIRWEVAIVLALSLGASAVYSVVRIIYRTTDSTPLSQQSATLNQAIVPRPEFDLVYQLLAILTSLAPVALVVFLLWQHQTPHLGRLGIDGRRWGRDALWGVALAIGIGIPGLAVYLGSRALGIAVDVVPSALDAAWWTVPILLLSALRAGIEEEVIMVGYLFARWTQLGWRPWAVIVVSALIRGTYHLYQGFGAFIGNLGMGLLFGWLYHRFGRLLPLVIAHAVIDAAVFVGYGWARTTFPALFGA